jgi:ComF family protein
MFSRLLRAMFPGACLLCDLALPPGQDLDLCACCRAVLPWITGPCRRCGLPLPAGLDDLCTDCRHAPPPWTTAVVPLRYEGPVAQWIRQLKDHAGMVEGRTLGLLLADAAADAYGQRAAPDLLVPVPLTLARLARRGHNQAIALALPIAARLRIPLARTGARRTRRTPPQRGLRLDARLANLTGAFAANRDLSGLTVGIVDDVLTTGATVAELGRTLIDAGAAEVHVFCAARAIRADRAG